MNKQEMPKLKPCPFCGGEDIRQEYGAGSKPPYNDPYVVCVDCGASVEGKSGAWNSRADLPPTPSEAMRCPEVMALVESMRSASSSLEAIALHSPSKGSSVVAEAAWRRLVSALAALEQAVRHE